MSRKNQFMMLSLIALIFMVHFFLRIHNTDHLPFFVDEHRHIRRAESAFIGHPAEESMGKFLLYVWLFPFQDTAHREASLHVSRNAVALFSLIGLAALYAITRKMFGHQAAIIAITFYALAPLALFYERMALADGLAGAFATLTAWQSVRLAERPTYRKGIIVGALAGLAIMAKVTMTFVTALPILAVLLLGTHTHSANHHWRQWLQFRARKYMPYLVAAGATCIIVWLPTLIPAAIEGARGKYYALIDTFLLDQSLVDEQQSGKVYSFWQAANILFSTPFLYLMFGLILAGLWKFPGKTLYGMAWLFLVWFPGIAFVWRPRTRYFSPGAFALALIFAGGVIALQMILQNERLWRFFKPRLMVVTRAIPVVALGAWAVLFALPFANKAASDAASLRMPRWDQNDYFRGRHNAYQLFETLDYLEEEGQPGFDGKVDVIGVYFLCSRFTVYYIYSDLALDCRWPRFPEEDTGDGIKERILLRANVLRHLQTENPLYMIVDDYHRYPWQPYLEPVGVEGRLIHELQRPMDGVWVSIWRLCHKGDTACLVADKFQETVAIKEVSNNQ